MAEDDDTGSGSEANPSEHRKKQAKREKILIAVGVVSLVVIFLMIRKSSSSSSSTDTTAQQQSEEEQLAAYESELANSGSLGNASSEYTASTDPYMQEMFALLEQIETQVAAGNPNGTGTGSSGGTGNNPPPNSNSTPPNYSISTPFGTGAVPGAGSQASGIGASMGFTENGQQYNIYDLGSLSGTILGEEEAAAVDIFGKQGAGAGLGVLEQYNPSWNPSDIVVPNLPNEPVPTSHP